MARFEKGEVFGMNTMIDYADGGVVREELIHNNAGSVTLFSFGTGQGLSEHTAPFDALIQVIDGEMELTVEETTHVIKQGEAFGHPQRLTPQRQCVPSFQDAHNDDTGLKDEGLLSESGLMRASRQREVRKPFTLEKS